MLVPTLVTERLLLRPLRVEDAEALYPMFRDPETMRYWHEPPHSNVATTRDRIAGLLGPNSCCWAICLRPHEEPIGMIDYLDTEVPRPGMGYMLQRAYWRQGYMTEAVHAALDYGFEKLGLDRVELWIHEGNSASQRLAQKSGFRRRGQFRQDGADHDTLVFGLYHSEWTPQVNPPNTPRFDALQPELAVPDVEAAVAYYRDLLGFTAEWIYGEPPGQAMVSHREWMGTGVRIQLHRSRGRVGTRSVVLVFDVVSDIDALYANYVAHGVHIVEQIEDRPWGSRDFTIEDLNGYRLRFTTP